LAHSFFSSCGGLRFFRRIRRHLDAMGIMNQTVEDAIGDRGSPICSCRCETGNWEVRMVERVW